MKDKAGFTKYPEIPSTPVPTEDELIRDQMRLDIEHIREESTLNSKAIVFLFVAIIIILIYIMVKL